MNKDRHYELTNETIEYEGHTLHRIRCTESFFQAFKGDFGGYVESYNNLIEDAWVDNEAKVYGNAIVSGKAFVGDWSIIKGNVIVEERAKIEGESVIVGIYQNTSTEDYDGLVIKGTSHIVNTYIKGDFHSPISNAHILNGILRGDSDYIVFKNWWSSGRFFTWTRSNDTWCVGCFYGTGKNLIAKAYKDSKLSGREYERVVKFVEKIKGATRPSLWKRIKRLLKNDKI